MSIGKEEVDVVEDVDRCGHGSCLAAYVTPSFRLALVTNALAFGPHNEGRVRYGDREWQARVLAEVGCKVCGHVFSRSAPF